MFMAVARRCFKASACVGRKASHGCRDVAMYLFSQGRFPHPDRSGTQQWFRTAPIANGYVEYSHTSVDAVNGCMSRDNGSPISNRWYIHIQIGVRKCPVRTRRV